MEINWLLVGICAIIWLAGYCFGYSVGKTSGIKEVFDKMIEFVDKLPKKKGGASNGEESD